MFFIMGITNGKKELEYDSGGMNICKSCGVYGRYKVFCTYMCLSIFFIPTVKWSKRYFVECSSCGTVFEMEKEIGKKIEHGENVAISSEHIKASTSYSGTQYKKCFNCGYMTEPDFDYCPRCGNRL